MKKGISVILSIILTISLCSITFIFYFDYYLKDLKTETIKTETVEKITITDNGIADSVLKVYDAVGSIENYVNNKLYSSGSGFVFKTDDSKGYILTNYHVIEKSDELYFILTNGKKIKVEVVGSDEYSDIAVLSIDKSEVLKTAMIGSSDNTRIGDTVFTVGAPLDSSIYYQTVTRGILSGKDRVIEVKSTNNSTVMEALQTDAAINSGNSGGPLCNSNGEVIGINSMKLASSSVEGMGFAIPIEIALDYSNKFINNEKIRRPYLGVSTYSNNNGVYIYSVEKDSPAYKIGLQKDDLILKINDTNIQNSSYLKYELYKYNIGDTIKITYKRNNTEYEKDVKLGVLET